jgi:hypothetical protein
MRRLSLTIATAFLGCLLSGCGDDQPNAPATAEDVNSPDFAKKTADMMKAANSGMDLKKAKAENAASKK